MLHVMASDICHGETIWAWYPWWRKPKIVGECMLIAHHLGIGVSWFFAIVLTHPHMPKSVFQCQGVWLWHKFAGTRLPNLPLRLGKTNADEVGRCWSELFLGVPNFRRHFYVANLPQVTRWWLRYQKKHLRSPIFSSKFTWLRT